MFRLCGFSDGVRIKRLCSDTATCWNIEILHGSSLTIYFPDSKGANVQADLHPSCSHTTKSGFHPYAHVIRMQQKKNHFFSRQCSQFIKSAKILADHCIYSLSILRSYSETCLKRPLREKTKNVFHDQLSLNEGQKYCRMLPLEHSAILLTFIKLPFVMKIFVLPICEWPLKTGFTVI